MNFSTIQTRLAKPILPEAMLREYALQSRAQKRSGASQIPDSDKVDLHFPSESSTKGSEPDILMDKMPSDIRVLCLEIIQQGTISMRLQMPLVSNNGTSTLI
jgi:hypothetical protein